MPFNYEFINEYQGLRSPSGTVENDLTTWYFFRCLYQRALSIVDFTLPEEWNKNYFKNVLFNLGYIGIIDTAKFGIIPQICNVSGYGLYLQPTKILVAQPLVNFEGTRGENCELIRLTPDYRGILDIVEHYAVQLAKIHTSINMSLINSRVSMFAYAKNKNAAETLKVIAEKISSGESLVICDKELKDIDNIDGKTEPIFTETFDVGGNYITDKLLDDYNTILSNFDKEIGIPVIDDKRERRIEQEVNLISNDSCARVDSWEVALRESIDDVLKVFPDLNIDFTFKKGALEEYESQPEIDNDRTI